MNPDFNAGPARAFPITVDLGNGETHYQLGITTRDYFAAKAMQSFIAVFYKNAFPALIGDSFDVALEAYKMADQMIAVRANK